MRVILAAGIIAVLGLALAVASGGAARQQTTAAQLDFLKRYWRTPIAPQGLPPKRFSAMETSLAPETCGVCHQTQYADWKTTVHSQSAGPGLLGQTPSLLDEDPDTALMCYSCHAPLTEQQEVARRSPNSRLAKNDRFDASLQRHGLTCVACHVRNYQRFGPPNRDGSLGGANAPHGGATRTPAFERAEFCAGCHQFEPGDRSLNGKFLENTYNEWKSGPFGQRGVACQQCHMPDRRHLWRGIHDPAMVKWGVTIDLRTSAPHYAPGDTVKATLTLANTGVGHYFPTYLTPKVVLRVELVDSTGRVIAGSAMEDVVGRTVALDLSEEVSDTRIPPEQEHSFRYQHAVGQAGISLHALVTVYPDDFYQRFYEAKLEGELLPSERLLVEQALLNTRRSVYVLFEKSVPVS